MSGALALRTFDARDAEAVRRLHDVALSAAGAHGGHGPWEDDLRDVRAAYLDSGGAFLVGLLGERLVAMGGLLPRGGGEVEIRRMRVHPDVQRRGYGRLLLDALEQRARALGAHTIRLDTTTAQVAARALYERAGYRETGRRRTPAFELVDYAKALDER